MATTTIKFTKTALTGLIKSGVRLTVNDTEIVGLKFKIGTKRSSFIFEKRISGSHAAAVRITIGSFPAISVDEARVEAYRLANLCERGIDPRAPRKKISTGSPDVDLQTLIDKFFEVKTDISPRTKKNYETLLGYFPDEWLSMSWNDITPEMIANHFHLIGTRVRSCQRWLMVMILSNIYNTCSPFFKDADGQRIMRHNPIPEVKDLLKSVKRPKPKQPVIPAALLGKAVIALEKIRSGSSPWNKSKVTKGYKIYSELVLLGLFCGFRSIELFNLRWSDVDLKRGTITLPDYRTKNRKGHTVILSTYPARMLAEIAGERKRKGGYVFSHHKNPEKKITRNLRFNKGLSKYLGQHFSLHATRRTFASIAHDADVNTLSVKRMLNHHYKGDVTSKYIKKDFNPGKELKHFQVVCDYILDRRAESLGETRENTASDQVQALGELERLASRLGLDLETALELLSKGKKAA